MYIIYTSDKSKLFILRTLLKLFSKTKKKLLNKLSVVTEKIRTFQINNTIILQVIWLLLEGKKGTKNV